MKPQNLNTAKRLCAELQQLKHHQSCFASIMTEDIPEDQFMKQQEYALQLQTKVRKLEKEISEL